MKQENHNRKPISDFGEQLLDCFKSPDINKQLEALKKLSPAKDDEFQGGHNAD